MTMFSNRGCATGLTWDVRARTPADRDGTDSCKTLPARAPALPGGPHQAPRRSPHFRSPSSPAGEWRLGDGREALWSAGIPARPCLLPPRLWSSARCLLSRVTQAHPSMTMLPIRWCATGLTWNVRARMPADRDGTQSCKTLPAGAPALPGGAHHAPPGSPLFPTLSLHAGEWRLGGDHILGAPAPSPAHRQVSPNVSGQSGPSRLARGNSHPVAPRKPLPARAPALPGGPHHAPHGPPLSRTPSPATSARRLGGDLIPGSPPDTPPEPPHFRVPSPPREGRSERVPSRRTTAPPPRW